MIILRSVLVSEQPAGCCIHKLTVFKIYTGIVDSSGIRLYFTDQPPQQNAGIMTLGQPFMGHMIVPPHVDRYTITGHCPQGCTDAVSI